VNPTPDTREATAQHQRGGDAPVRGQASLPRNFLFSLVVILLCFALPLSHWARFALQSDLFSYVLLVPIVSIYLFLSRTGPSKVSPFGAAVPSRTLGTILGFTGVVLIAYYATASTRGITLAAQDAAALIGGSFALCVAGASAFLLPAPRIQTAAFPLFFLLFMAPFPVAMEHAIEMFLQHGSAPPSYWFFKLAGTPVYREGLIFQLPGMTLQIAPECSGIRSTIVLFLTSLVASHLFLRSTWKRALLVGFVLPLALVRNGFRIFVIGELCVHIGPHMIDSVIHHRGGPIFFALSLIPFSILVYFLVKSDRTQAPALSQPAVT
jgi:exosortase C (VPDSG-CTERM-specific)